MKKTQKCMAKGCNKPATEEMLLIVYNSSDPNSKVETSYRYFCEKHYEEELKVL